MRTRNSICGQVSQRATRRHGKLRKKISKTQKNGGDGERAKEGEEEGKKEVEFFEFFGAAGKVLSNATRRAS